MVSICQETEMMSGRGEVDSRAWVLPSRGPVHVFAVAQPYHANPSSCLPWADWATMHGVTLVRPHGERHTAI